MDGRFYNGDEHGVEVDLNVIEKNAPYKSISEVQPKFVLYREQA